MGKQYGTGGDVMRLLQEVFDIPNSCMHIVIDLKPNAIARIIRVDALTMDKAEDLVEALKQCNAEVI